MQFFGLFHLFHLESNKSHLLIFRQQTSIFACLSEYHCKSIWERRLSFHILNVRRFLFQIKMVLSLWEVC